jgi:preprotein translocase subunit SecA
VHLVVKAQRISEEQGVKAREMANEFEKSISIQRDLVCILMLFSNSLAISRALTPCSSEIRCALTTICLTLRLNKLLISEEQGVKAREMANEFEKSISIQRDLVYEERNRVLEIDDNILDNTRFC